jgi:hypothetical protein
MTEEYDGAETGLILESDDPEMLLFEDGILLLLYSGEPIERKIFGEVHPTGYIIAGKKN